MSSMGIHCVKLGNDEIVRITHSLVYIYMYEKHFSSK